MFERHGLPHAKSLQQRIPVRVAGMEGKLSEPLIVPTRFPRDSAL